MEASISQSSLTADEIRSQVEVLTSGDENQLQKGKQLEAVDETRSEIHEVMEDRTLKDERIPDQNIEVISNQQVSIKEIPQRIEEEMKVAQKDKEGETKVDKNVCVESSEQVVSTLDATVGQNNVSSVQTPDLTVTTDVETVTDPYTKDETIGKLSTTDTMIFQGFAETRKGVEHKETESYIDLVGEEKGPEAIGSSEEIPYKEDEKDEIICDSIEDASFQTLAGSPDTWNDDEETNGAEDKLEGLSVTLAKYRASQQGEMPQVQEVDYSETFKADPKIGLENIVMDRTTEVLNQDGNSTIEDSKRDENYNNMPDGSSITREEGMQSKDEDLNRAEASAVEKKGEEGFTVVVTEDNISKRELSEAIEHSKLASTENKAPSEYSLLQQNEPGEQKPERLLDVISQEIEAGASRENAEFENPKYCFEEKRKDDEPTGVYDISGDEIPGQKNLLLIDSNEKTESAEPEISKYNANGVPVRHSLIEETRQVEGKINDGVLEFEPEEHIEKSHGTSIYEKEQIANTSGGSKGTESTILEYTSTEGTVRKEMITKTSENTGEIEAACRLEAEENFVVKDTEANTPELMKEQAINTETHKTTAKSNVPEEGLLEDDTTEVCSAAHTGGETVEQRVQMDSPKEAPTKSSEDERNKIIPEEGYDEHKMQGHGDVHRDQIVEANVTFVKPEPSDKETSKNYQDDENETKKSREEDLSLEIVEEVNVNDPSQQSFGEGPVQNFEHDKKEAKKSTGEICEELQTAKAFESIAPETIQNAESQEKIPGASLLKQEEGFQGEAEYLASAEASAEGGEGDSEQQPQINAPGQSIVAKSTENIVDIASVKQTEGPQEEGKNLDSIESSKENTDEEPSSIEVAEDRPKPKVEGGLEHISHNDKAGETNHEVESPGEILYTVKQGEGLQRDNENVVPVEAPIQRRDEDTSSSKVAEYNSTPNRLAEASENSAKATPEDEDDSENALRKHRTAESFALETPQGVESPESIPDPPPVKQEEGLKAECENLAPTEPAKEERGEDTSFVKVAGNDYANIGQVEATENRTKTTPEGGEDSEKVHNVEDLDNNLGTSSLKQGETLQGEGDDLSQKNSSIENASPVTLAEENDDNIRLVETMENSVKVTEKGEEESEEVLKKDDPQENLVQEREYHIDNLLVNQEEAIERQSKNLAPTEVSMENKNEAQQNMLNVTAIVEDSKHVLQKDVLGESISSEADFEVESPEELPYTPLVKQEQGLQGEFKQLIPTEASIEKRDEDTSSMKIAEGNNDNNGLVDAADHSARITAKGEEASEQVFQKDEPGEKLEQLQGLMSKEIEEESSREKTTKTTFMQEEGLAQNLEQASATEKKEAQILDENAENEAAIKKVVSATMPEGLKLEDEILREMTKTENTILECVGFETAASSTNTETSNLEKPAVAELPSSSIVEVTVKESLKEDESGATKVEGTDLDFIKQTETTDLKESKESKSETLQDYAVPNKDFNAFTHAGKSSLEPEVSEEEIKKESLKQEENTIIGSDYESVGVVSEEAGLKEVGPENNEQTKSSGIAPEGKDLEATETEGISLDTEKIEHHVEGKAPSRGIENEIAFTMGEAPLDKISEVSSRDSCMMPSQEHDPRITGVSKTVEEIPATEETRDENAKNTSMQKTNEKLTLKEDECVPSKDISKLTSLDGGNKGVIEEAQKDTEAESHMYPELHNQKNSSDTEDVEISKRGETSCLAEQTEAWELETSKDDNPSNEVSKSIAVNTHGDGVEDLLEQEDAVQSLTGGITEEGTADVKTGAASHESEPISTKNDEPLAERTLELADLDQKLDFDSESVTKDQSDETHPQTNKIQTEENKDLQDWDSKSVEQKVILQFQGETEREREMEPKLEAEDHIDSSQNAKESITNVVAMEEVQERVENVDGSEGVKEMAKNGVSDFKEIHEVSDGDEKLEVKDCETVKATDSNELKETGNTGIAEELTIKSDAPEEEKIQGEDSLEPADVYITTADDAEEKIEEEIRVEVDDSLEDNDNATVVPAESSLAEAQMDEKPVKDTSSDQSLETIKTESFPRAEEMHERVENVDGSEGAKEQAKHGVSNLKEIHEVSDGVEILEKEKDFGTESTAYLDSTHSNEQKETGNTGIVEEPTMESKVSGTKALEEEKIQGEGSLEPADVYILTTEDAEEKIEEEIKVEVDDSLEDNHNANVVPVESSLAEAQMDDKPVKDTSSDQGLETIKTESCPKAEEMPERVENVNGSEGVKEQAKHGVSDVKEIHEVSDGVEILEKVKDSRTESTGYLDSTHSNEQKETGNTGIVEEPTMESKAPSTKALEEEKILGEGSLEPADVNIPTAEDAEEKIEEEIKVEVDDSLEDNHNATVVPAESSLAEAQMDDKPVKDTSSDESLETIKTESCPRAEEVHERVENIDGSESLKEQAKHGVSDLKEIHEVSNRDEILEKVKDFGIESTGYLDSTHSNEQKETGNTGIVEEQTMESEAPGTKAPEEEKIQGEGSLEPADVYIPTAKDAEEKIEKEIKVEVDDSLKDNHNATVVPAQSSWAKAQMDDKPVKDTSSYESLETIKTESCPKAQEVQERVENVDGSESSKDQAKHGVSDLKEIHQVSDRNEILEKAKDSGTESTAHLDSTHSNEEKETGKTSIVEEPTVESEAPGTKGPEEEKIQGEGTLEPADVYKIITEDAEEKIEEDIQVEVDDILQDNDNIIVVPKESSLADAKMDDKPVKDMNSDKSLATIKTESYPRAEEVHERVDNMDESEGMKEQDKHGVSDLKEIHEVSDGVEILEKVKDSRTESTAYLDSTHSNEEKETGNTGIAEETTIESEVPGTKGPEEEKIQGEGTLEPADVYKKITEDAEEKIEEDIKMEVDDFFQDNDNVIVVPAESSLADAKMDDKPVKDMSSDESLETIKAESYPRTEEVYERVDNVDGSEGLKEIHEVSDGVEILEKVKDSGTESTGYLDATDSNEHKETGITGIVEEQTMESEELGTKAPGEEKIQVEGSLEPADVYMKTAEDAEEKIEEDIKVEVDDFFQDNENIIVVPAESSLAEAKMDDKPAKDASSDETLETIKTESYPRAEEVHERVHNVDGSEDVKEQDKHGVSDLKEIREVSDGVEILEKVKDSRTESTGYLDATDSNEHKETGNTGIVEEQTMESEALGTKALREEKIQGEGSLEPADVYMKMAEDAEEKIEEEIKVEADDFLEDNDNGIVVPAAPSLAEAQMDDKPVKDTSLNESLETIKTESCPQAEEVDSNKLENATSILASQLPGREYKNEDKVIGTLENPDADEVEESKTVSNAVFGSEYHGVEETPETGEVSDETKEGIKEVSGTESTSKSLGIEAVTVDEMAAGQTLSMVKLEEQLQTPSSELLSMEQEHGTMTIVKEIEAIKTEAAEMPDHGVEETPETGESSRVKKLDSDETKEGIKEASGTESTSKSLGMEAVTEDEMAASQTLAMVKLEEQLQTPTSELLSMEQEHGTMTIVKEIEATEAAQMPHDTNIDDSSSTKATEETCLQKEEQLQTLASALSGEQEHGTTTAFEKLERESTREVETLDDMNTSNSSATETKEETCSEQEEPTVPENVENENVSLDKPDKKEVEETKTISNTVCGSEYQSCEEATGTEDEIKEASATVSKALCTEAVTEDERAADQTLPAGKLAELLQTKSSELLSLEQEHVPTIVCKDAEEIKIKEMEMEMVEGTSTNDSSNPKATDRELLQKEEQLQTPSSELLSEEQEHVTTTAFKKAAGEESTKEVETQHEKNINNSSATKKTEDTCLEQEDISTKVTSSAESVEKIVESNPPTDEVASVKLEDASSNLPSQLSNIINKGADQESESLASLENQNKHEVEENKSASVAVFESKKETGETKQSLSVEKLDAADIEEIKETSETFSKSKAPGVEEVTEDELIADQTFPSGKLGEQLQTPSSFLPREQKYGTTTTDERMEEDKIKEVKMLGDEIHNYFSAAKTTEGTCLKNTVIKELETSELGLESSEADPNEEQKEEGSTLDQASKLEPRGMEDIIYADSPSQSKEVRQLTRPAEEASNLKVEISQMTFDHESEVQSDQVLTKSEGIDEKHREAAITDLKNEESQSKKTVEVLQILKDDVSIEEVTEEEEVAKDSKSVSLGEEQIIESHQRDESKAEEYPPEETNKTFKATTTTNQHEALGFQITDKDSGSEGIEKNITAQVRTVENENPAESYPNEMEGKNVEQAAVKLDSRNQSDETNVTKGKTEAITLEDKEPDGATSQKEGATDFSEVIEITQNIQQLEKTSYAASKTEIPGEADLSENKETIIRTDQDDVIPVLQHKIEESLQKVELEDKIPGRATEVEAEVREVECEGEKRMDDSEEKITEDSTSADLAKSSLSELMQKSMKENLHAAKDLTKESEPTPCKEEMQNEEAETTQIDEAKIDEEEEDEHKRADSGSDAPVMVEASKETDVKVAHKKSHNILSGVGSKVKHSLSKVKKAITGKSSHPKTPSPNQ